MKHWIRANCLTIYESPLVRGRGLKPAKEIQMAPSLPSPLVRGRGLKRLMVLQQIKSHLVAPRAGAWIETKLDREAHGPTCSRPSCGGVD